MRPIVIEGTDCVGKTTLCAEIRKRLKYNSAACGPPNKRWTADYYVSFLHPMVVYDRSFPSSFVYDRVRRNLDFHIASLKQLSKLFSEAKSVSSEKQPLFALILADNDYLASRYAELKDPIFTEAQVLEANEIFREIKSHFDFVFPVSFAKPFVMATEISQLITAATKNIPKLDD